MNKKSDFCRVCNGPLFPDSLLKYENSPKSAQGFIDELGSADDSITLEIYQCQSCGLVQHNMLPVSYYKEVIRAVAFSKEMGEFRLSQLSDWIKLNNLKDKKILEVGCGRGEYVDLLKNAGANQVSGLEFSQKSVDIARNKGNKVYLGYLDTDFKKPYEFKFDAFTIFSFLEHWPNPNEGLELLHSVLSDDASGLVEVPNFELVLAKGLYSEFTTDHIFYFDKKTFAFLLEKNGFEVISIKSVWYDYILSAEVRKRPKLNVTKFLKIQEKIKSELGAYIGRYSYKTVAIWGAGHQALAVIAMSNCSDHLKYIIDSASFKQGKYTPATHLPIMSPDTLNTDSPEAIIVMAAGYSNEVVRLILDKYPSVKNIAVLRENQLEVLQ